MSASRKLSLLVFAGFAASTPNALPQRVDEPATSRTGAEFLRQFLDDTRTFRARFEQALVAADGEVLERATGELSISRPSRFVWRYVEPLDQLVVADGADLWIYDAELSQATVTPLEEATHATPAMLLSGDAALDEEFDVRDSFEDDGLSWVRLTPRPAGADFKEISIGFEAATLRRLELLDSLEQLTTLVFAEVEVNVDIADAEFDFVPPPGVDVIGGSE